MKKIVLLLLSIVFVLCSTTISHAQKDKNKGLMFTTSSNEALSYFSDGLKFFDLGDNVKAREYLLKAIEQDPGFSIAYVHLATLSNTPQEFVSYLDKAKENLSSANEWEKLLYDYTETYLTDNLDKRLSIAQKMTGSFPNNARACYYQGQAYDNRNDFINARKCYQKAVSLEPGWTGGYVALVNSFMFADPKDFSQAEKAASKLVSIAPYSASYILLGDTYRAQNNLQKAAEMYSKAMTKDDASPAAYYKRGHVLSLEGQYDQARSDYEKAGSLDISPTMGRQFFSYTYLYGGEPAKALESLLNDINKMAPSLDATQANQFTYNLLLNAAMIAMHDRDAQKLEEIVTMLEPLSDDAAMSIGTQEAQLGQKGTMLYWQGMLLLLNNDISGATQKADEIKTTLAPINNPLKLDGYNFLMGSIALQQNDFGKAISYLEKTNQLDVYEQYCLAKAYEGAGEKDKADAIYKYLLNYNFNNIGYALVRNELKKKM